MAIHPPGQKFRHNRLLSRRRGKREVVAILSLTAMVDMFTVLVVFLLQSYRTTGEVLFLPKEVTLPQAERIKELQPAVVVTISNSEVLLDKGRVITFQELKDQKEWMIPTLYSGLQKALQVSKEEHDKKLQQRLQKVIEADPLEKKSGQDWNKVTIQADKNTDFLTIKKVMYTVSEAGAGEINFAVTKEKAN